MLGFFCFSFHDKFCDMARAAGQNVPLRSPYHGVISVNVRQRERL